jgi:hypothetical protein
MTDGALRRASEQDGSYPRPQLLREHWADLNGPWEFEYGDGDDFGRTIIVPFPPESRASGIGDTGFHPVLRYRRRITAEDLVAAGHAAGRILLLHFGAVDYRADVWVDGQHALTHEGGSTPFTLEVPAAASKAGCEVVVRAFDDPHDLTQPRGKQDWELEPHVIWYPRTSGIWQGVWLESEPTAASTGHRTPIAPRSPSRSVSQATRRQFASRCATATSALEP